MGTVNAPYYPQALQPGDLFNQVICFIGLQSDASQSPYDLVLYPKGTFYFQQAAGKIEEGAITQTAHGYDIIRSWNYSVYGGLPHTLYGNQLDQRYDPNYNLKCLNPGTNTIYGCDAVYFMTAQSDNPFLAADFQLLFNGTTTPSGGTNVYVGSPGSPSGTPISSSLYTFNPYTGTVVFGSAQASNAVISIDGVPQGMAPEKMLYHLFNDYGNYNPTYFKFDTTNIILPTFMGGQDYTVWEIAQYIVQLTAPRSVKWRLRVDEYGYILFYEDTYASTPTETLVDEHDLFSIDYTYTAENIINVAQAQAQANNGQQITAIAYDIDSINKAGQTDVDSLDSNLLIACRGIQPLQVVSFLNSLVATVIWQNSRPTMQITCEVLPNPARQVGDKINIIEKANGLSGQYVIKGITDQVDTGVWTQSIRLQQANLFANFNMGVPAAIVNAPPGGTQGGVQQNINVIGKTNIIQNATVNGTYAIQNGSIVYDQFNNPVIPIVQGAGSWSLYFKIDPAQAYDTTIYQMLYAEVENSLSSTDLMAIRLSEWVTNDGAVIPASTIAGGYSRTGTHSTGTATGSGEKSYLYSQLITPAVQGSLPYSYGSHMTTLSWLAGTGLSGSVGFGYGGEYSGSYLWYPQNKWNYYWWVIMAFNANGATGFLRIPFILSS